MFMSNISSYNVHVHYLEFNVHVQYRESVALSWVIMFISNISSYNVHVQYRESVALSRVIMFMSIISSLMCMSNIVKVLHYLEL